MLTSSIFNTRWCHSVDESCNFMDSCIVVFGLAGVIANNFGQLGWFVADVVAMLPLVFCNFRFCLAGVIVMLLCYMVDVIAIRLML